MNSTKALKIEELERLEAAATPGDWRLGHLKQRDFTYIDADSWGALARFVTSIEGSPDPQGLGNLMFTIAFRNAAKPLLAMVKRQGNEIADLRRQLAERDAEIERLKREVDEAEKNVIAYAFDRTEPKP